MHSKTAKLIIPLVALVFGSTLPALTLAAALCVRNPDCPVCHQHQAPHSAMDRQIRPGSAENDHRPCCSPARTSGACHTAPASVMVYSRVNGHMTPSGDRVLPASMGCSRENAFSHGRLLELQQWGHIGPATTPTPLFLAHQAFLY